MSDKNLMEIKQDFGKDWLDTLLLVGKDGDGPWWRYVNALKPVVDLEVKINGEVVHHEQFHEFVETMVEVMVAKEKERIGFEDHERKFYELSNDMRTHLYDELEDMKREMISEYSRSTEKMVDEFQTLVDNIKLR